MKKFLKFGLNFLNCLLFFTCKYDEFLLIDISFAGGTGFDIRDWIISDEIWDCKVI